MTQALHLTTENQYSLADVLTEQGMRRCSTTGCQRWTSGRFCNDCDEELRGNPCNAPLGLIVWFFVSMLFWAAFFLIVAGVWL